MNNDIGVAVMNNDIFNSMEEVIQFLERDFQIESRKLESKTLTEVDRAYAEGMRDAYRSILNRLSPTKGMPLK